MKFTRVFLISTAICALAATTMLVGCSGGSSSKKYLSIGTAPSGGAFAPVGNALAETLNEHKADNDWDFEPKGTKGSQENIRKLDSGDLEFALSNAAITYFATKGEGNFEKKFDLRVVMTLAPNVAMFLSTEGSGVKTMADLKGNRVVVGPAGAGFEMFVGPILEAHGLSFDDFDVRNAKQSDSVDMLSDGSAQASFLGGAPPTGSIIQACSSQDIVFVPYDADAMTKLVADYEFFKDHTLPKGTYDDLTADLPCLNVGSMHLITTADEDEELVYQVTKTIYNNREAMIRKSKTAGRAIEQNATLDTGVEFHPGAIRFYKEIGIWEQDSEDPPAQSDGTS